MKTLIVYMSVHNGNTKKIAKVMAEVLGADLFKPDEISPEDVKDYGLVGFGSGIYFGRHHKSLLKFIENTDGKEKKAFIFSTSGNKKLPVINNFDRTILKKLSKRGFDVIGSFNCRGRKAYYNNPGMLIRPFCKSGEEERPNKKDIENARIFAERMKDLFSTTRPS